MAASGLQGGFGTRGGLQGHDAGTSPRESIHEAQKYVRRKVPRVFTPGMRLHAAMEQLTPSMYVVHLVRSRAKHFINSSFRVQDRAR